MSEVERRPLDRHRIVEAAFAVLDEGGIEGLGMRSVGRRLKVNGSALYWHVRDRSHLVEILVATVYERAFAQVPGDLPPDQWPLAFGRQLRANILAHRNGAQLCAEVQISDAAPRDAALRMAQPLIRACGDERRAILVFSSIVALVLGWTVHEQNGPLHRALTPIIDFTDSFEASLTAMLGGFGLAG